MSSRFTPRLNPPLPDGLDRLFSAVLSDALDANGVTDQVMSSRMRPLDESLTLWGRARTGAFMEVPYVAEGVNPYELEIAIVDDLKPGDIAVFACGGSTRIAPVGIALDNRRCGCGLNGRAS